MIMEYFNIVLLYFYFVKGLSISSITAVHPHELIKTLSKPFLIKDARNAVLSIKKKS